ncbi:MAG: basic amino acid/polyamine antiporter, partial [Shewanella sp.]
MATGGGSGDKSQKLGLVALVSIVVSSMIGSGIDGLPQAMSAHSALGAVVLAWLICGVGMFCISRTFIVLSDIRPDLNAGIYMYAQAGFGPFTAFLVAWGYWLMTVFSSVAFAVMIMDTMNYFMPGDFTGGNNFASLIGSSLLIWGFNYIVLSGLRVAGTISIIGTIAKMIPLVAFIGILVYHLNDAQLSSDIWANNPTQPTTYLGSVFTQTIAPLDVALWCFIGVEGAVALSGRSRQKKYVGKATSIGFLIALCVLILVSILPFGVLPQAVLSQIPTPSTAGVLKLVVGEWGELLITVGVLISVLTSWLAWTLICAEIPMVAANNGTFPTVFSHKNAHGAASNSLWVSSGLKQLIVILAFFAQDAWLTMLAISGLCVLPAYLGSTAYLCKISLNGEFQHYSQRNCFSALLFGFFGLAFCVFMFYSSQLQYLALVP